MNTTTAEAKTQSTMVVKCVDSSCCPLGSGLGPDSRVEVEYSYSN